MTPSRQQDRRASLLFGAATAAAFIGLAWLERRRALREEGADPGPRRIARNLVVGGLGAVAIQLAETPAVRPVASFVARRRMGLLPRLRLPPAAATGLAVVLLDWSLYWWHRLLHVVPTLYRAHQVHHSDLELDTTTALRFHVAELVASVPWRVASVVLIGATPRAYAWWQRLLVLSILFHHSNLRLPTAVERWLSCFVMTPRLHGIHHSIVPEEQNANWSSGLTCWDALHGTLRRNVPQDEITIGIPAERDPDRLTVGRLLEMPLDRRDPWRLPSGQVPLRAGHLPPTRALAP